MILFRSSANGRDPGICHRQVSNKNVYIYVYNICSQSSENFLYGILSYLSCIPMVPGRDMGNQYMVKY